MKHYRLTGQERVSAGFTDLFIVTHADFSSTEVGVSESVTLAAMPRGDVVMNALLEVKTPAAGLTVALGTFLGLIVAVDLLSDGDPYYATDATAEPVIATADTTIQFQILPNTDEGDEQAVGDITAGEFWIWAAISRKADRTLQA